MSIPLVMLLNIMMHRLKPGFSLLENSIYIYICDVFQLLGIISASQRLRTHRTHQEHSNSTYQQPRFHNCKPTSKQNTSSLRPPKGTLILWLHRRIIRGVFRRVGKRLGLQGIQCTAPWADKEVFVSQHG